MADQPLDNKESNPMKSRSLRWLVAVLVPFALLTAACGDDDETSSGPSETGDAGTDTTAADDGDAAGGQCAESTAPDDAPEVVIGAQDFGESAILAEVYKQCFEAAGYTVSIQEVGGFRDLEAAAFESGDINFAPEYAASMLEFLNEQAGEATSDVEETVGLLNTALEEEGLVALTASEAVDTNAFVVTQATSDDLGLTTLSDLADHADLTLGAPADCETNAFCLPGLQTVYGVDLSGGFTALEPAAIVDALSEDEIDIALLFSTDSRIATNDFVLLEDDQGLLAADNVLPVLTSDLAADEVLAALADLVSGSLTTDGLTELNRRYDVDTEDADAIAADHLTEAGLL
jgi:osmoprotectant transport system substrate-binding protein